MLISGNLGAMIKKLKPQINHHIDYIQLKMEATSMHTAIQEDKTITIHINIEVGLLYTVKQEATLIFSVHMQAPKKNNHQSRNIQWESCVEHFLQALSPCTQVPE